ncbi:MAG: maleylpyruvate isomerase family mycothiol-dependent enzyme [Acidimicrobiales bacterium]
MQEILAALAEQHRELAGLLDPLTNDAWSRPSRCAGWTVSDVVLHLAQTDELALASLTGSFGVAVDQLADGFTGANSVDAGADAMVAAQRGASSSEVRERWRLGSFALLRTLAETDPSARVPWVVGDLAARTLATTRLAECWIHTGDVLDALGRPIVASDRMRHIVRLAWRTLPYAFEGAGLKLTGPVELLLTGPAGEGWDFVPEEPAVTTIMGTALDLCQVAGQRAVAADTGLSGSGPDVDAVLELIRTFA